VRLDGSLEAFSLPEIFQLLTVTGKSGGLHVSSGQSGGQGGRSGIVRLVDGAVSGASSDTTRQTLVRRLVCAGLLTDESLSAGVARVRADPTVGLARALQEAGSLDDARLFGVAREHTVDALFDMLRWAGGDFTFEVNEADADDLGLRESAEELLGTASQRVDAWPAVAQRISSPDVVLCLTPAPADDPALTRGEWALVALIDGRRSIRDLVARCGREESAVLAVLARLIMRGLLEVPPEDGDEVVAAAARVRRQHLLESIEDGSGSGAEPASLPEPPAAQPEIEHPARRLAAAADAEPRRIIERDPAVNQSMLLRLVAGVRAA
jgi:hypothetical protein